MSGTRVCIKNLPLHTSARDLKDFLSNQKEPLEITDVQVLKNKQGKSRKVAFVGFRFAKQADFAVNHFDKSFMRSSRLSVQPALAKTEKSKEQQKEPTSSSKKKEEPVLIIPEKSKKKGSNFWGNDEEEGTFVPVLHNEERKDEVESSDSSSSSSKSEDEEDEASIQRNNPVSDLAFLRSKQSGVEELAEEDSSTSSDSSSSSSSSSSDSEIDDDEKDNAKSKTVRKEDEEKNDDGDGKEEETSTSNRLFVRNLPFGTTEEELGEYFSVIGKVTECHVPMDDQMKNNKGFAFVSFVIPTNAKAAMTELDKKDFQGRLLHILPARAAPSRNHDGDTSNLTWKQRQELTRKEKDISQKGAKEGWSASFVRGDAVVDNLAEKLGLRKGDILGVKDKLSSGDAAVRLALGETQIIQENRTYFEEHGVDMEALVSHNVSSGEIKRSKTWILVKNLPFDTTVDELTKLFSISGQAPQVLLPPSRSIALIQYFHVSDAKTAFRKLAYRRFKHVPVYLEWAPLFSVTTSKKPTSTSTPISDNMELEDAEDEDEETTDTVDGVSSTIYVKNLNFQTTEEILKQVFSKVAGEVRSVRIPQKVAPDQTKQMSMGFGFVEVASLAVAKTSISKLNGTLVDGYALQLALSSSKQQSQKAPIKNSKTKNPTKLMVRNVPFQATRKELLKLFGAFGQLSKVRLPKKFDGSHRGFAFVEFLTSKEATNAYTALAQTHLYGRHLVLEWASQDDLSVDELREKTKRQQMTAPPQNKRIKFSD
jgi:multiple RNA-binding domain-containing protein 1